jgi:hypothetical protein
LPINYTTPVAVIPSLSTTTWTSAALTLPGDYWFAIRAFNTVGEEQNIDAAVEVLLSGGGTDISGQPVAPMGLRALATAGGGIRVEWAYHFAPSKLPAGFHVYVGTGAPGYATPAATVNWGTQVANMFVANLSGYTGGATYAVGVRAFNASGEEQNTNSVSVTASGAGPSAVLGLSGTVTS